MDIFSLSKWMKYNPASHSLEFWFVLKGKAGSRGERGPPGKPVSIVYLVVIFSVELLSLRFNYALHFSWKHHYDYSGQHRLVKQLHILLSPVIYIIITWGVCTSKVTQEEVVIVKRRHRAVFPGSLSKHMYMCSPYSSGLLGFKFFIQLTGLTSVCNDLHCWWTRHTNNTETACPASDSDEIHLK